MRRERGLGTALVNRALERLKKKEFSICVTEATSFYSQKIFDRIDFKTLAEIKYEDYKVDGEVVFPPYGPHQSVKLMVKQF